MSPCDLSPILLYGVNSSNGANGTNGANSANSANGANVLMVPMVSILPAHKLCLMGEGLSAPFPQSLCDEYRTDDDKRDREYLAHIEQHASLESLLVLLCQLYEESEGEDIEQYQPEIESGACQRARLCLAVDTIDYQREQGIGYGLIELSGMAWQHVHSLEYECPGHGCRLTDYLGVHQVSETYAA